MNPYTEAEVELLREGDRQERASMQMLASVIALLLIVLALAGMVYLGSVL